MALRKEIWLILILIATVAILVSIVSFFSVNTEQADARRFVEEDLKTKFPDADTEILSIAEKKEDNGQKYFEIKARVTRFQNTACPERLHTYYNYPKQNFVNPPDEVITKDCHICTNAGNSCVIAFPEEAIIASHTLSGTEQVGTYVRTKPSVFPTVRETTNSWIVIWDSGIAAFFYEVEIARNGSVISVKKLDKDI